MIEDKLIIADDSSLCFDKMRMALAIKASTYEDDLGCSLIENGILNGCSRCNLQRICEGIEEVAKDYYDSTARVLGTFNF